MNLLTITSISLGLAADYLAVSLTSGLIIRHVKINKALKIALFFGIVQGVMPFLGWLAGLTFRDLIAEADHWLAFSLLLFIGGKMIYEAFQTEIKVKNFNPLDSYTLFALAIATSIDALAVGLGILFLRVSILLVCTFIGMVTFIVSFVGVFIGNKFGDLFGQKIEILGGLILIFMVVKSCLSICYLK